MKVKIILGTILFLVVLAVALFGFSFEDQPLDPDTMVIVISAFILIAGSITFLWDKLEVSLAYCANVFVVCMLYITRIDILKDFTVELQFSFIPYLMCGLSFFGLIYFMILRSIEEIKADKNWRNRSFFEQNKASVFNPILMLMLSAVSVSVIYTSIF